MWVQHKALKHQSTKKVTCAGQSHPRARASHPFDLGGGVPPHHGRAGVLSFAHSHALYLSCALSLFLWRTLSRSLSRVCPLYRLRSLSRSRARALSLSLSRSLSRSRFRSRSRPRPLSRARSLSPSLPLSLPHTSLTPPPTLINPQPSTQTVGKYGDPRCTSLNSQVISPPTALQTPHYAPRQTVGSSNPPPSPRRICRS